jgi:DNA-directed RNA polymerase sigma subunit (sigma70/sigma32)|tara:strand:- start:1843 stop:2202 length:360 start_codon:yes stop_codon:yes gene_type:complete
MRKISEIKTDNRKRFAAYAAAVDLIGTNQFEDLLSENAKIANKVNPKRLNRFYNESLKDLDYDEKQIIDIRHGLDGASQSSFSEIADIFGEPRSKILKKYSSALDQVRPYFQTLLSIPE